MNDEKLKNNVPSKEEITELYKIIQRNESENIVYKNQLDRYFSGNMPSNEVINVCGTPNILKIFDSKARKIIINQADLKNALADRHNGNKNDHTEPHDIDKKEIYKLPEQIRNPIMVLVGNKRNENSIVLVTELKNKAGEHLIVPIALDRQNGKVNRITTIYGKKNLDNYLEANLSNIIALNEKKADNLLSDIGFQLPKSTYEAVIRYDDSIAYSVDNVKHPVKENQRENQHDDISAEEIEKRTSFKALDTDKDKVGRIIGINLPASPEQQKELIPQKKPKGKKNIHEQKKKKREKFNLKDIKPGGKWAKKQEEREANRNNKQVRKDRNKGIGD